MPDIIKAYMIALGEKAFPLRSHWVMNTNEKRTTYIFLIYFPSILTGEEEYFIIPVREMKKEEEEKVDEEKE